MRTAFNGLFMLIGVGAALYVLFCLLLYWRQENAIFFPTQNDPSLRRYYEANRIELHGDGATLEGWSIEYPQAKHPGVILYFGGNAEDVLRTASMAAALDVRRVVFFNYRGYGHSTGAPSQTALYADASRIYDYLIRDGVSADRLIVMGRSLGSGMATMLAGSRPVAGVVLVTPFDSLAAVAAEHYPAVPVRLLLRHPFPSLEWAVNARAPALFLVAERDRIIPPSHAQRLFDQWPARKELHLLASRGHNDIDQDSSFYPLIETFIASLDPH
jgi:pimeloyl-ACP methyl ester carboxylesterase